MKDFDAWHELKKQLDANNDNSTEFHEREIWWCSIGVNIGREQDGKNHAFERPVLIIRKFNNELATVVPLSSKIKTGSYFYTWTDVNKVSSVLLMQLRLISAKRLQRIIKKMPAIHFVAIKQKLIKIIKSENPF